MGAMNEFYTRQLTPEEIAAGEHRKFVGGLWNEIGALQFNFLLKEGLLPSHKLVDIGCGALRCGIPIIRYLDEGNYYGLDINASLIEAGKSEIAKEGLTAKCPTLLVNDRFELSCFAVLFDYAIAQSLFTHLDRELIRRCLIESRKVLTSRGKLFCTFFQAPEPKHGRPLRHKPGGVVTYFDRDPFHYSFSEIEALAKSAGFLSCLRGQWEHPRDLRMIQLSPV